MFTCPACGTKMEDGQATCQKCGRQRYREPQETETSADVPPSMNYKGLVWWILGPLVGLPIVGMLAPSVAYRLALLGLLITFIGLFVPIHKIGLSGQISASIGFVSVLVASAILSGQLSRQEEARLAVEQEQIEANRQAEQARIAELRGTDPQAYLDEIEEASPDLWYEELAELNPDRYRVETERREAERIAQIEELTERVRGIPASDTSSNSKRPLLTGLT